MQHLPVFADIRGRDCLVVGGGIVAERRARRLIEAGARVTVQAPDFSGPLEAWGQEHDDVRLEYTRFREDAVSHYWLIIAATSDREINKAIASAAERAMRLCNVVDDPELCSFIMPAIIDRSPITIAISSAGTSPVVSRWIKGLIESLVPQRIGRLAQLAGTWRERVREQLPNPTHRLHFWQAMVTGNVARHTFSGHDAAAEAALAQALQDTATSQHTETMGEAWLVEIGPGDPELISLRAHQLIASADVVIYEHLIDPNLLQFARQDAEWITVGDESEALSLEPGEVGRLLVERVARGERVCYMKGGNPFTRRTDSEEVIALTEAGLLFRIVPGISADMRFTPPPCAAPK